MKVLLINSPIRIDANPNCIPYGLATIAAVLRAQGFDVEIYDVNALRPLKEDISKSLKDMTWDLVGLSGLITTYKFQKWLIPELKAINSEAPVVSGGGLATSNSELLFNQTDVDITVIGEGEQTMLELCRAFKATGDLKEIPGIWFRQNGNIVKNEVRENIQNLNRMPFPAWDLLPMQIYLANPIWGDVANNSSGFRHDVRVTRSMNIISSRGCPFSCRFCYHLFGRSNYRFRSPQNVVDEIEILADRYEVDFVGFVDDNMMASERRLLEFCDLLEDRRFHITWGCHGRVTSAKAEVLERMAKIGCVWIGYGIESGSQKILDAMNKKATVAQAKEAVINTRRAGIYPNTTFIFGYPGETLETIQETIDFKREMGLECGSFFATPYPGTHLYEQALAQIQNEESFIQRLGNANEFSINLTEFDDETLFDLKKAMDENRDVI
ncbi:MAG: B12-binding domain-containing radical SAM protein [Deltaproteobacteria bacterium]|nr:B12-binding domain-containing radical SAM protein [Deltaproteobacteria bacterium]